MAVAEIKDCWIVVPAFNEELPVGEALDSLVATGHSIVFVDDGSTDRTRAAALKRPVHVLRHAVNLGQGAALQTGIQYALANGARYIVTFDSDGQHLASDIPALLGPLVRGECQIVLGTRFRNPAIARNTPWLRRWILRTAAWYTGLRWGVGVTDTHNGLRAMTSEAARRIHFMHNGMAHASEILEIIAREKLVWREADVSIQYTEYSLSKGQRLSNSINILWERMIHKVR